MLRCCYMQTSMTFVMRIKYFLAVLRKRNLDMAEKQPHPNAKTFYQKCEFFAIAVFLRSNFLIKCQISIEKCKLAVWIFKKYSDNHDLSPEVLFKGKCWE